LKFGPRCFRNYPNHVIGIIFNYFNPLVKYLIFKSVILIGVLNTEFILNIYIYSKLYVLHILYVCALEIKIGNIIYFYNPV